MKFRNTLAAAVVLSSLIAWVYFYEYRGEEAREASEQAENRLADFDPLLLTSVRIVGKESDIKLVNEGGRWWLDFPLKTLADQGQVSGLFSAISKLKVTQRLGEMGRDLSAYGLDIPAVSVTLNQEIDSKPIFFEIGARAQIGENYYARLQPAGEIVTITGSAQRLINARVGDLRYKKIVGIEPFKVSSLRLAREDREIHIVRSDGKWAFSNPIEFPAATGKVSNFLHELFELSAEGFEESNSDLSAMGLNDPDLTLWVTHQGGQLEVRFSSVGEDNYVRALRDDMPDIFKITSQQFQKLHFLVDDFRDPRMAPVDRWSISGIHTDLDGVKRSMVKDPEANWRWKSLEGPMLGRTEVDALLDAVEGVRAIAYLDVVIIESDESPSVRPVSGAGRRQFSMKVVVEGARAIVITLDDEVDGQVIVSSSETPSRYIIDNSAAENLFNAVAGLNNPSPSVPSAVSAGENSS